MNHLLFSSLFFPAFLKTIASFHDFKTGLWYIILLFTVSRILCWTVGLSALSLLCARLVVSKLPGDWMEKSYKLVVISSISSLFLSIVESFVKLLIIFGETSLSPSWSLIIHSTLPFFSDWFFFESFFV